MSSKFSYLDGGNGKKKKLKERFYILQKYNSKNFKGEFWFISHDLSAEDGIIRSISDEGDVFVPQQGWQYLNTDAKCTTVRYKLINLLRIFYEILVDLGQAGRVFFLSNTRIWIQG